jgi:hypothetical protein
VQVRLLGDKTPSAAVRLTFGRFATATSVPTRHSPAMREMSVTEQRYKAVRAVIADGRTVSEERDLHQTPLLEQTIGNGARAGTQPLRQLRLAMYSSTLNAGVSTGAMYFCSHPGRSSVLTVDP